MIRLCFDLLITGPSSSSSYSSWCPILVVDILVFLPYFILPLILLASKYCLHTQGPTPFPCLYLHSDFWVNLSCPNTCQQSKKLMPALWRPRYSQESWSSIHTFLSNLNFPVSMLSLPAPTYILWLLPPILTQLRVMGKVGQSGEANLYLILAIST